MRTGIIYRATTPNGKKYYGRSIKFLSSRKYQHLASVRNGSQLYFHNAIRKYGPENIKWEVVEKHKHEDKIQLIDILNEREIYYIEKDNTLCPNGYNLNKGGGNYCEGLGIKKGKTYEELYGKEKAKVIKKKMSEGLKGKTKGRIQTRQEIEKRVKANIGKKRTQETKEKIRNSLKGKKFTKERRKNISESLKGNPNHAKNFNTYIEVSKKDIDKIVKMHIEDRLNVVSIAKHFSFGYPKVIKILKTYSNYTPRLKTH